MSTTVEHSPEPEPGVATLGRTTSAPAAGSPAGVDRTEGGNPPHVDAPLYTLGRRPGLDGIRGIGCLIVVLYHFWWSGIDGFAFGNGSFHWVTMFFVLSGFLITSHLVERNVKGGGTVGIGAFVRRRARRIAPAAFAYAPLATLVNIVLGFSTPAVAGIIGLSTVLGVSNFAISFAGETEAGILGHLWSIAAEVQFYVAWPFVIALIVFRSKGDWMLNALWVCAGGFVAGAVLRALLYNGVYDFPFFAYSSIFTRMDGMLAGCAVALAYHRWGAPRPRWWMPALGVLLMVVTGYSGRVAGRVITLEAWMEVGNTIATAGMALIVAWIGALPAGTKIRVLCAAPIVWVGSISYSLYVWHFPFIAVSQGGYVPMVIGFPLALAMAIGTAYLSYRFVELRFWKPSESRTRAQRAAAVESATPAVT